MTEATSRLGLPLLEAGQAQKEITHNEALALIDAALGASVVDSGVDAPPTAAEPGQCWLIGDAPSGAWTGRPAEIAVWTEGGWRFLPARTGMTVWVESAGVHAHRTDAAWIIGSWPVTNLVVGDNSILTGRQPAIAIPTGGGTIDAQARSAVAALISAMQVHGLID